MEANAGQRKFVLAVNKFADMTNEEYRNLMLGYRGGASMKANATFQSTPSSKITLDTVDWRDRGLVVGIKDQGQCGSCWAFSAIASLEGQHAKRSGELLSFSEQELVDCAWEEGNEGCNGGFPSWAFDYLRRSGGVELEQDYPYEAQDDRCRLDKKKIVQEITGFVQVESGSEEALQQAVTEVGPLSIGIDAGSFSFQFYQSGVYDERGCGSEQRDLNHGVTVIGYGVEEGHDYWLVKNSWGEDWGDEGYIRMSRNKDNQCGIATDATYPLI